MRLRQGRRRSALLSSSKGWKKSAAGRTDLHRRLGVLGFALLAMILIVAVPTTIVATKLGGNHMPGPALPGLALVAAALM